MCPQTFVDVSARIVGITIRSVYRFELSAFAWNWYKCNALPLYGKSATKIER